MEEDDKSFLQKYADKPVIFHGIIKLKYRMVPISQLLFIYYVTQQHLMKNNIVIGIVVAMAVGVVITGSTLPAALAQGNMTAGGGGNMTAGGGDIVQQLKVAAATAKLIDNKKMFIIACDPSMTDPDTQCVVANLELR
jgi:hypothetical protein